MPRPRPRRVLYVGGRMDGHRVVTDRTNQHVQFEGCDDIYVRTVLGRQEFYRYINMDLSSAMKSLLDQYNPNKEDTP